MPPNSKAFITSSNWNEMKEKKRTEQIVRFRRARKFFSTELTKSQKKVDRFAEKEGGSQKTLVNWDFGEKNPKAFHPNIMRGN